MAVPGNTTAKNQVTPNFLPGVTLTLSSPLLGGRNLGILRIATQSERSCRLLLSGRFLPEVLFFPVLQLGWPNASFWA
jgi:hypothetical protein